MDTFLEKRGYSWPAHQSSVAGSIGPLLISGGSLLQASPEGLFLGVQAGPRQLRQHAHGLGQALLLADQVSASFRRTTTRPSCSAAGTRLPAAQDRRPGPCGSNPPAACRGPARGDSKSSNWLAMRALAAIANWRFPSSTSAEIFPRVASRVCWRLRARRPRRTARRALSIQLARSSSDIVWRPAQTENRIPVFAVHPALAEHDHRHGESHHGTQRVNGLGRHRLLPKEEVVTSRPI